MGEFDLIERYFKRPARNAVLGVGDDCALLQAASGTQLAISCDMLVEGRHFLGTVAPQRLGHKALAVNLSDLAACGAEPMGFVLALALPRADAAFLAGFADGLYRLAEHHAMTQSPLAERLLRAGKPPRGRQPVGALHRLELVAGDGPERHLVFEEAPDDATAAQREAHHQREERHRPHAEAASSRRSKPMRPTRSSLRLGEYWICRRNDEPVSPRCEKSSKLMPKRPVSATLGFHW